MNVGDRESSGTENKIKLFRERERECSLKEPKKKLVNSTRERKGDW